MVTMTDDIVTFIRARLDDADQDADGIHRYEGGMSELTCDHIIAAGHDACTCRVPHRLRREVEAKRRRLDIILIEYDGVVGEMYGIAQHRCAELLKIEALPYSDHPDYRAEWRP